MQPELSPEAQAFIARQAQDKLNATNDFNREFESLNGNSAQITRQLFGAIASGDHYKTGSALKSLHSYIPQYVQYMCMRTVTSNVSSATTLDYEYSEHYSHLAEGYDQLIADVWPQTGIVSDYSLLNASEPAEKQELAQRSLSGEYHFNLAQDLKRLAEAVSSGYIMSVQQLFDSQRYLHELPITLKALVLGATLETKRLEAEQSQNEPLAHALQDAIDTYIRIAEAPTA